MKSLLKEPLIHFIILGIVVFIYYEIKTIDQPDDDSYEITLDEDDINRLIRTYQLNWNSLPDSTTMNALIDEEIKSEIFFREAKRLNLHHNDEIIRRRLRQKYEFLIDDLAEGSGPNEIELKEFFQRNQDDYKSPEKWSFKQYYFQNKPSPATLSSVLENGWDESKTNNFHISINQDSKEAFQIERSFGAEFMSSLRNYKTSGWVDSPIRSGFGWHIVDVEEYIAPSPLTFEEARDDVLKDWQRFQRSTVNETLYKNLQSKYEVNIPKR